MNRKEGVIKFSTGEGYEHFKTKCEICWWLKKNKIPFYCEAIFETGGRADVLADYDKYGVAYEIHNTETKERMIKKTETYPSEISLVFIKAGSEITDEIMN